MDTKIKQVEILPLIKYYMDELGLARLFDKYVPNNGMDIAPAQVLSMMVMNIMVSTTPLYRMEDWLHDYLDVGRLNLAKPYDRKMNQIKSRDDSYCHSTCLVIHQSITSIVIKHLTRIIKYMI